MPVTAVYKKLPLSRICKAVAVALILAETLSPRSSLVAGELEDFLDLSLEELTNIQISVASKVEESVSRSTSHVTVITEQDITRSGARNLMDVLRTVPGYFYYQQGFGENALGVRGANNRTGAGLLMLLNGHVINQARSGSATFQFTDRIPVNNIRRIEIIKGPGSSVYGSNAYLGVINIITRNHLEGSTGELAMRYEGEADGSIANQANLFLAWQGDGSDGANLNLNVLNSNGAEVYLEQDTFGQPGYVDNQQKEIDGQFNWKFKGLGLQVRAYDRDAGDYFGPRGILTNMNKVKHRGGFVDIGYTWDFAEQFNFSIKSYYDYAQLKSHVRLFGTTGENSVKEARRGAEARLAYHGYERHTLVVGLSGLKERVYDPRLKTNENNPGGPLIEVPDEENWIKSGERENYAVFAEDLWDVSESVRITIGARFDHYNDFGDTFNPRLGASWALNENFTAKLSYATAFRAPDLESQLSNAPLYISGSPDLEPEEVEATQLSLSDQWSNRYWGNTTIYYNEFKELIYTDPADGKILNGGFFRSEGIEIERGINFTSTSFLRCNFSFVNAELSGGNEAGFIPKRSATFEFNHLFANRYNWNISAYWQGESERTPGDLRKALNSYSIVNTTLLIEKLFIFDTVSLSAFNLTDREYAYPSQLGTNGIDYPAVGRSFSLSAKLQF